MPWIQHIAARLNQARQARHALFARNALRQAPLLQEMEPRILLSAAPIVTSDLAGIYTAAFAGSDDVIGVNLVAGTSANGGVIVDLTYVDDDSQVQTLTLGTTAVGIQGLVINAGAGDDRITTSALAPAHTLTIIGGADNDTLTGPDVATNWSISASDAGSASGITAFNTIENLTGRGGVDVFTLLAGGVITGQIDGGNGDDTIVAPNAENNWAISGTDAGMVNSTRFLAIENLTGGSGIDIFRVQSGEAISGQIAGGGGVDTLFGPDLDNIWQLTGVGIGKLNVALSDPVGGTDFIESDGAGLRQITAAHCPAVHRRVVV